MVRRIVTVSGSAVSNPKNLEVRIGTPIEDLLEACGGFLEPPNKLLMGGPMMGNPLFSAEVPVIKGTNAILAFYKEECPIPARTACYPLREVRQRLPDVPDADQQFSSTMKRATSPAATACGPTTASSAARVPMSARQKSLWSRGSALPSSA